jgi:hypothetical protein
VEKFVNFVAVELPIVLSVVFYCVNVKKVMEVMDDLTLFVIDNHNEAKITTLNTYHYFQSVVFVGVFLYHSHRSVGVFESKLDWHEIWWN